MEVRTDTLAPARHGAFTSFLLRLVREKPLGTAGGIIFLAFLIVGTFANFIAPHGMYEIDLVHKLEPSSTEFLLGTDHFGRDVLSRVIYGARISMIVGISSSILLVAIATIFGLLSGYWGGKFDLIVQRFVDAWLSFPPLFIILTVMALLGPGMLAVILVIGVLWGINNTRTIRSVVIGIKENVYIEAAVAIGCSTWRILWRHILPQVVPTIIVMFTCAIAGNIIMEATVSFLGYGIPPPQPSWGSMLSVEGRKYMLQSTGLALWPGLALAVVVYGVSMFGDAVRDILDPKLRGGAGRYGMRVKKAKVKSEPRVQ